MTILTGGQIDVGMRFSNSQTITGAAISENIIDLGAAREFATGPRPIYVVSVVTEAFTDSGNNSNVTVILQTDSLAAFNSGTNTQTIGVFATNAAIGTILCVPIGQNNADEQYLALYYDVGGGNHTTGKITSFLSADITSWAPMPKGYVGPNT